MKPIFKRILSGVLSAVMTVSAVPITSVRAEESVKQYPYTMFAASSDEGAITVNASNFCVNGNICENTIEIYLNNSYFMNFISVDMNDDDGDGLWNYFKNYYGSDKNVVDTDEDGLSDYVEVYLIGTDPMNIDTDSNGILDCDEDADQDGINNRKELEIGSNLIDIDTDGDMLEDGVRLDNAITVGVADGIVGIFETEIGQKCSRGTTLYGSNVYVMKSDDAPMYFYCATCARLWSEQNYLNFLDGNFWNGLLYERWNGYENTLC